MASLSDLLTYRYGGKDKSVLGLIGDLMRGAKNNPANKETLDSILGVTGLVPGVGDAQAAAMAANDLRNKDYLSAALNGLGVLPMVPALGGVIKQVGVLPKNSWLPKELPSPVVKPVLGSLPESGVWDKGGFFATGSAADGLLRKLENGDYVASLVPAWLSKTKSRYAIGDDPNELVAYLQGVGANSQKSVEATRTAKVPKDVRSALESEFGKVFSYDISNAAGSGSYYITHKPTGTKIRVSDHALPSYYENTAAIDIHPDDIGQLPAMLREIATPNASGLIQDAPISQDAGAALRAVTGYAEPAQAGLLGGGDVTLADLMRKR